MKRHDKQRKAFDTSSAKPMVWRRFLSKVMFSITAVVLIMTILLSFCGCRSAEAIREEVPISLYDLLIDSNFIGRKITELSDKFGNVYKDALYFSNGRENNRELYNLNGKYASLSGTVFVPKSRESHSEERSGLRVMIYGDGKRLWASPRMQINTRPVDFNVNVSGVEELELRYIGYSYRSIGIGNIKLGNEFVDDIAPENKPMWLEDLEMVKADFPVRFFDYTLTDRFGRTYTDGILYSYGSTNNKDTYLLGGNYHTLKGTAFVPLDRRNSTDNWDLDGMYYMQFWGDEKLLWTSPRMLDDVEPQTFEIDVTGVNLLTFTYYGGSCTWDMEVALADLCLQ